MTTGTRFRVPRVAANYTRLLSTLLIGIAVVPLTIGWLGDDAFGLIALLGANIGLAAIVRQIVSQSLIRELGVAYHAGDAAMARSFPAICRIALAAAGLTLVTFGAVAAALPLFNMPDEFRPAAYWFVGSQGVQVACAVALAPVLNMYMVTERFASHCVWYVAVRAANIVSVVLLGYVLTIDDPARGLLLHAVLWSSLSVLGYLIAAAHMIRLDPRVRPTLRRPEPGAVRDVLGTFSWNSGVQIAMNLHEQIPPMLLNFTFGTPANAAWGVGFRLVAYIRMVTVGMQFGSDAVSARLASSEDQDLARTRLQRLLESQTRLTALVSVPAAFGVFVYCFPIMHLWVGRQLDDYDRVMGMAVVMSRVLAAALAARAIADTWILVLYGAGFVRRYALVVIAGGFAAPVIALTLLFTLPDHIAFIGPAIGFTTAYVVFHLGAVPFITARCLHVSPWGLFKALGRPVAASAAATAAGLGVLAAGDRLGDLAFKNQAAGALIQADWMLASIAAFGMVYAPLAYAFVLGKPERDRIGGILRRVLRR